MQNTALLLAPLALLALFLPAPAGERLEVVTTIPDLADIAREIGGERVRVQSLAEGKQNIHGVRVKASHIVALGRADAFVQMGLSMEHAWVPGLLMTARNPRVSPGGPGFIDASLGWEAIDVPETLSRREGADLHPEGNPHFNLSLRGGEQMADRLLEGLARIDPQGREHYRERHARYVERLEEARGRWREQAGRLAGAKVVCYHTEFDYLLRELGIEVAGTVEPKPGVPPSAAHIARLLETMERQQVRVVVTAPWSNNRAAREVASRAGGRLVELPDKVEAVEGASGWIETIDLIVARLSAAHAAAQREED